MGDKKCHNFKNVNFDKNAQKFKKYILPYDYLLKLCP